MNIKEHGCIKCMFEMGFWNYALTEFRTKTKERFNNDNNNDNLLRR